MLACNCHGLYSKLWKIELIHITFLFFLLIVFLLTLFLINFLINHMYTFSNILARHLQRGTKGLRRHIESKRAMKLKTKTPMTKMWTLRLRVLRVKMNKSDRRRSRKMCIFIIIVYVKHCFNFQLNFMMKIYILKGFLRKE